MSRIILVGLFFLLFNEAVGQTIQILNGTTRDPIVGAIVYEENQSTFSVSDETGIADLSKFKPKAKLIIQHPSFHIYLIDSSQIDGSPLVILLKEKIIKIDEVIISANKWEQKESEIPFEILSLNASEIAFGNVQTSADALEATGQVFVQKSQLGGGSPMIRGFGANAVLIVVDGVRMNNTIFRGGNLQNVINIDPNSLESSEVIFGPGAVIYGSDALGGVMDFHTIKPSFSHDKSTSINGHGMLRYSSANQEKTGNALISIGKKSFAYVGSFSISDFDDLKTGSVRPDAHPEFGKRPEYISTINESDSIITNSNENLQRFSGYMQFTTLQKFAFRLNDHSELTYTFNYSTTSDIPRYDRLILYENEQLEYARWNYGPQLWMMNALKYNSYKPTKLYDAVKYTVAFQIFEESRHDRKYQDDILRNRTEKVGVFSFNTDFEKDLDLRNHFYYGLDYNFNHVNSSAFSKNVDDEEIYDLSTRYPNGGSDVHNFAIYSSYKLDIKPSLFFNAGLRYNFQHLFSRFNNSDFTSIKNKNSAVNGNLGIVFKPNPNWNISGMLSTGFRAPNVDDISKVFDSEPGNVIVPNPDLTPEYSYNAELSISRYFNEKVELSGTAFYSFLRNAMVRGDFQVNGQDSIIYDGELSKVQAIVNTGKADIYGFNAAVKFDFSSSWSAFANVNVTRGEDRISHEPLRHTTPVFGMLSVQYKRKKFKGEFYTRYNGNRKLEDLPPSERNKTHLYSSDGSLAWYTLNLRAQYQINGCIGINGAVENMLDHHYRTYSSGISAPGRNFVISIKAKF